MSDVISSLAFAVANAVERDLPDIEYERFTYVDGQRVPVPARRRPNTGDVEVYHFPQTWGNTALGFGGIAGQAFTTAYTTVVIESSCNAAVYFGGRLAYVIRFINSKFYLDLNSHQMAACSERGIYRSEDHK